MSDDVTQRAFLPFLPNSLRLCLLAGLIFFVPHLRAQTTGGMRQTDVRPVMPNLRPGSGNLGEEGPPNSILSPKYRAKLIAEDRRKRMLSDAKRLLQLAQALNDEVEKTAENQLNVDAVKKADEMRKLAQDLKERMTQ